ncbi:hypothetical protein THAR02_09844 [Trichoderma harzianum]|uniref:Uncharacterized protein n=1 Tax=Trichoderma harzianum TaxID=5544 RepID=A0A0F9ZY75_TRIHA|nr:hypothetical protein THAR02_09844 [Trichoderma harzianum]
MNPQNNRKELYADLILDVMIQDVLDKIARCQKMLVPLQAHCVSLIVSTEAQNNLATEAEAKAKNNAEIIGMFNLWVKLSQYTTIDNDKYPPERSIVSVLKKAPDFGELIKTHLVVLEHTIGSYNCNIPRLPSLDGMSND